MSTRAGSWQIVPVWQWRVLLITLACGLVAMGATLFILVRLAYRGPGLSMTNVVVESSTELCPGEWLMWHHRLTLDDDVRLPARLFVTRTVYNSAGMQVYDDDSPLFPVIDSRVTPRERAWQLPDTDSYGHAWQPGDYTLDYGASLSGRAAIVNVRIPFRIRGDCGR